MKSGASELLFFYTECTKTHLQAFTGQKIFPGAAPGPPRIRGRGGEGRGGRKGGEKGKGKGQGDGKGREGGKEGGKRAQGGREGRELGLQPPKFLTLSTPLSTACSLGVSKSIFSFCYELLHGLVDIKSDDIIVISKVAIICGITNTK
jgi:hypothetical protein